MSLAMHGSVSTKASGAARLDVVPLTKHIGAEIRGIDLREKPDEATVKAIYKAWLDPLVLIFPVQKIFQEDLICVHKFFAIAPCTPPPAQVFPQGLFQHVAGHHSDLESPRNGRADRGAARRRD